MQLLATDSLQQSQTTITYDRILKVSRTVAELEGSPQIQSAHISGAGEQSTFVGEFQFSHCLSDSNSLGPLTLGPGGSGDPAAENRAFDSG